MFAVAGLEGLPNDGKNGTGAAGPNQLLADAMGVIVSERGDHHTPPIHILSLLSGPPLTVQHKSSRTYGT
jgi:hypothetical protein